MSTTFRMPDDPATGVCPGCDAKGIPGTPCTHPVCRRRGYHVIPEEYLPDLEGHLPDPLIGVRLGDYLVVRLIGVGGFGRVYLSLQLPIRMKVALKLINTEQIPASLLPDLQERFEAEARALARLDHPGIVRLIQYGTFFDRPYLVMDYIEGGVTLLADIQRRAQEKAHYSVAELRSLFAQMVDALASAHLANVIHRDIKPANIMLQQQGSGERRLRILDFGLAKFTETGNTTVSSSGTPEYMAPEQALKQAIGPWTDIYALGIVLFEMMTGRKPFGKGSPREIFFSKLDLSYDPVGQIADLELPLEVTSFFQRALAVEGRYRYQKMDEVRDAIDALFTALAPHMERLACRIDLDRLERETTSTMPTAAAPTGARMGEDPSMSGSIRAQREAAFNAWLDREAVRLDSEETQLSAPLPLTGRKP